MKKSDRAMQLFYEDMEYTRKYFYRLCAHCSVIDASILFIFQARVKTIFGSPYLKTYIICFVAKIRHWIGQMNKVFSSEANEMLEKMVAITV